MAKSKEVFACQNCGAASPKWQGQCAACGEWNTLVAEILSANPRKPTQAKRAQSDASSSLAAEAVAESPRLLTGSGELDRVLGGGLVPGSVTLIGGDPGIGKSTLMLQAAAALNAFGAVLYATGEESVKQVALRARRLGLETATARLIAETCVEDIVGRRIASLGTGADCRLHPDHAFRARRSSARRRVAIARVHRGTRALREVERYRGVVGRARNQGGSNRRTARARTHGRHRAVLRKRHGQPLSSAAFGEK